MNACIIVSPGGQTACAYISIGINNWLKMVRRFWHIGYQQKMEYHESLSCITENNITVTPYCPTMVTYGYIYVSYV